MFAKFSHLLWLTLPGGSPWIFITADGGIVKTRMMSLSANQKSATVCPFVLTQYRHWADGQTDRQTDRQTDGQNWFSKLK